MRRNEMAEIYGSHFHVEDGEVYISDEDDLESEQKPVPPPQRTSQLEAWKSPLLHRIHKEIELAEMTKKKKELGLTIVEEGKETSPVRKHSKTIENIESESDDMSGDVTARMLSDAGLYVFSQDVENFAYYMQVIPAKATNLIVD